MNATDVLIIGGGLAGLTSSIALAKQGFSVVVVERKQYPFHRVCGEYVSNEVKPYLEFLGLNFSQLDYKNIAHFKLTSPTGKSLQTRLDLGGFGISRYAFDYALYKLAKSVGVTFMLNDLVTTIPNFNGDRFIVKTDAGATFEAKVVLGAHGKHSRMDKVLDRDFTHQKSPYIGVKYHIRTDFPKDLIALHNFKEGYCGISAIEADKYCLCYLTTRQNLRTYGDIATMEQEILWRNPHLKYIFNNAEFVFERPEVINEFSFAPKTTIENYILMVGDAAGLITPLCGNGMAIAIHAGKIAAECTAQFLQQKITRQSLENQYTHQWRKHFATRLWVGRTVQKFFGDEWLSEMAVSFFGMSKPLLKLVIKSTHGKPIY